MMNAQINPKDWQRLSEYLDGQLSPREQAKLENLLETNEELRSSLEELRRMRAILRSLPRKRVPRNFTLTPDMVPQKRTNPFMRWVPALSLSSALAAVMLVVTVIIRSISGMSPATLQSNAPAQPQVEIAQAVPEEPSATQEATPMIILWGGPANYSGAIAEGRGGGPGIGGGDGSDQAPQLEPYPPPAGEGPIESAPSLMNPEQSLQATPAPTPTPEAVAKAATLSGAGPILGIPSKDQEGQIIVPAEEATTARDIAQQSAQQSQPAERANYILYIQIALGVFAAAAGVTALLLWRRSRS